MRPRYLINLINHCKSIAINLNHNRIEETDIEKGVALYSKDCVSEINLEIQDVLKGVDEILYVFTGCNSSIEKMEMEQILTEWLGDERRNEEILETLMWFGVLGVERDNKHIAYIYTVDYDIRRLRALQTRRRLKGKNNIYHINPAVWSALEIEHENPEN